LGVFSKERTVTQLLVGIALAFVTLIVNTYGKRILKKIEKMMERRRTRRRS
jgi:hypothetical protein